MIAASSESFVTAAPVPAEDVERRLLRALKTLRVLPDKDESYLRGGQPAMQDWSFMIRDFMDEYGSEQAKKPRFRPTPFDVSDMLTALSWCRGLTKNELRYIWWRSFDISFKKVALYIGRSDETARKRYRDALLKVWHEANAQG